MEKIKIGVSRCLLGENVRYDGGHQRDRYITETLGRYFDYVPVCPEVEYGLPVPREAMRLVGDAAAPSLVTIRTGVDHTEGMLAWAEDRMGSLEAENLCGFIFKSKSPSSGMKAVKVYGESGMASKTGVGIFAGAFMKRFPFLPVEEEGRLNDPALRENFIERVFVLKRWQDFTGKGGKAGDLIAFHTDHKLLVMSHSPRHVALLGKIAAAQGKSSTKGHLESYLSLLIEALHLAATVKKHTNVLQHIMGYFKKVLTADQKREMLELIETYYRGESPLVVPLTLINHYVRFYGEPYLKRQVYLNPHPQELMLRNHV